MGGENKRKRPLREFKAGDIVWIDYPYEEDGRRYRYRPALVYYRGQDGLRLLVIKITTTEREDEAYDYEIKYLKSAGLDLNRKSFIRCNHVYYAAGEELVSRAGKLAKSEIVEVIERYKAAYKKGKIKKYRRVVQ